MANYLTRTTWEPFESSVGHTMALSDVMDRLIRSSFITPSGWATANGNTTFDAPAVDVMETPESYLVKAALPGWNPDDVDITFENGQLTLKGEWQQEDEQTDEKTKWHRREIHSSSFQRTFSLPTEVDANQASADFEDGVLTLTLPKSEVVKPKQIKVNAVNSSAKANKPPQLNDKRQPAK